jgi:hypothetical protein
VTTLSLAVTVAAPAAVVFDLVTDWPTQGDWMLGTSVLALDGAPGVGQRLEAVTGIGRWGLLDTMVVTEWDPPHRAEVMHTGRLIRGPGVFEVVPTAIDSCRFVWSEHLELPFGGVGRIGWRVVGPAFAAGVRASLDRMARLAEDRHRAGR